MNLKDLKKGHSGQVLDFSGPAMLVERLREMGFYKGVEVTLLQRSPLNGPLVFSVSNAVIALRPVEAECILIQDKI